jgi:hypothetical protein
VDVEEPRHDLVALVRDLFHTLRCSRLWVHSKCVSRLRGFVCARARWVRLRRAAEVCRRRAAAARLPRPAG